MLDLLVASKPLLLSSVLCRKSSKQDGPNGKPIQNLDLKTVVN
jgi:hypothetical protein